jgi:hypothetical protein
VQTPLIKTTSPGTPRTLKTALNPGYIRLGATQIGTLSWTWVSLVINHVMDEEQGWAKIIILLS